MVNLHSCISRNHSENNGRSWAKKEIYELFIMTKSYGDRIGKVDENVDLCIDN